MDTLLRHSVSIHVGFREQTSAVAGNSAAADVASVVAAAADVAGDVASAVATAATNRLWDAVRMPEWPG